MSRKVQNLWQNMRQIMEMGRMSRGKTNFLAKIVVQVIKAFQTTTVRLGYRRYA